jgi:hypothetical protein
VKSNVGSLARVLLEALLDLALEISGRVDQALLEQGSRIRRVKSIQDLFEVIQSDLRGGMKNPKEFSADGPISSDK